MFTPSQKEVLNKSFPTDEIENVRVSFTATGILSKFQELSQQNCQFTRVRINHQDGSIRGSFSSDFGYSGENKAIFQIADFQKIRQVCRLIKSLSRVTLNSELGEFEVREEDFIAAGGSGAVFKIELPNTKKIAVKILFKEEKDGEGIKFAHQIKLLQKEVGFLRELKSCPNIMSYISSSDPSEKFQYIVSEFVEGESLSEFLETAKANDIKIQLQIARSLVDALEALENRGVVHRDLKPRQIIFNGEECVLLDFGAAQKIDEVEKLGFFVGTPGYFAPERFLADCDLSTKEDQYALGLTLLKLVIGPIELSNFDFNYEASFDEETMNDDRILELQNDNDYTYVSPDIARIKIKENNPQCPLEFIEIIAKLISPKAENRYSNVSELKADLAKVQKEVMSSGREADLFDLHVPKITTRVA